MLYLLSYRSDMCKGLRTLQSYAGQYNFDAHGLHKAGFEPAKPKHWILRPAHLTTLVLVFVQGRLEPTKHKSEEPVLSI